MWTEQNTGTNLPAQIELYATPGNEYKFLFMAKGGGSANKTYLFQETKVGDVSGNQQFISMARHCLTRRVSTNL